jgi:hypothetical protein
MCLILTVVFVASYTHGLKLVSYNLGENMSQWIFPFLMTYRYIKITLLAPVLFIFCDAPFIDSNQAYVMLRTRRTTWSIGQILYVLVGAAVYTLILFITSILVNIRCISWTMSWGRVLGAAGTTAILESLNCNYNTVLVSAKIINYFSPLQATFFSMILVWLSVVFLGLVIYVFNVITKSRVIGVLVAAFFVVFTAVADTNPIVTWFSPISWNSLNNIDIGGLTKYPTIDFVLGMYIAMNAVLAVIVVIVSKRMVVEVQHAI